MTPDPPFSTEEILEILGGLLASVSPQDLGEALARTLRELSGARCVLLLAHRHEGEPAAMSHSAPPECADLFSERELRLLCPLRRKGDLPARVSDLPAGHPLRLVLERSGVRTLHQSELATSGEHIGSVLYLDPPDGDASEKRLAQVGKLLPVCALALRNLLCTERIIEQSRELADYAEQVEEDRQRKDAAARDFRNRFETIFAKAPVPLGYASLDGEIVALNKRFVDTFGYRLEDIPTLEDWMCKAYPDPDYRARGLEQWSADVAEAIETGGDIRMREYRVACRDGRSVQVEISGTVFAGHVLGIFRDVSELRLTEEALRRSEERFRQVTEQAHEWIWETDIDGRFSYVSRAIETLLGYTPEEVVGHRSFHHFFHPEDREHLRKLTRQIFRNCEPINALENRNLHRDGHEVWLSTNGAPYFNEYGDLAGYRGSTTDITERKVLDAERERLLMAIEQAGETVAITDTQGIVEYVNPAFERITGYRREEILGRNMRIVRSEAHDNAFYDQLWETISHGEVWRGHFVNRRKDGTLYDEEATIAPVRDVTGKIVNYVATKLDVTERRQAEQQLRQKNAEMERFVYTVSHDLKSPLVTIKGFLGVLEEDIRRGDQDSVAQDMGFICDAADHMAHLLNDLLELSRVGRVVSPPVSVRFDALVRDALALVAGTLSERGVDVELAVSDVTLHVDRRRLIEVLQNLLENAVKYLGDQPEPQIRVSAEQRPEGWVFCVRDNGIGVAPKYHEKIFGLFEKLDPRSEGTGVGLALIRRIIELYEGRIWVESEGAGQGSNFCFTLPTAHQPSEPE